VEVHPIAVPADRLDNFDRNKKSGRRGPAETCTQKRRVASTGERVMNMAYNAYSDDSDYGNDAERNQRFEKARGGSVQKRRPTFGRAGTRPSSFNGIHRRRNKKFNW
jgi:hypothetical protein